MCAMPALRLATDVSFLIVGTPRSGTTLVQRLVCELPQVAMPPETHFFSLFARHLVRVHFPLSGAGLARELRTFASLEKSRDLNLDVDAVVADMGGYCARPTEMFSAIVRHLSGCARVYGEKSTENLQWWKPITRSMPELKIIIIVRDPRAVVASIMEAWPPRTRRGVDPHVLRAEWWVSDQRQAIALRNELGLERTLLLRYEDVVSDPELARRRLIAFLDLPPGGGSLHGSDNDVRRIVLPRETWKRRTFDPVTAARVSVWRETLTHDQAATIAAICKREMEIMGYGSSDSTALQDRIRVLSLHPRTQWRRRRFRVSRYIRLARIERLSFGSPPR